MRRIVGGTKDENGIYTPQEAASVPPTPPKEQDLGHLTIDDLLRHGLEDIYGIMRAIRADVGTGAPARETIMNLKDCMAMLSDLKKREQDIIDSMTEEQITNELTNRKNSTKSIK